MTSATTVSSPIISQVCGINVNQIIPNPDQPRKTFTQEELEEMASSIRQDGVLMPIKVASIDKDKIPYLTKRFEQLMKEYPQDGFFMITHNRLIDWDEQTPLYLIVYGERRWRGSRIAGAEEVPAIIDSTSSLSQISTVALLENMQRQDVNFLEEAKAIQAWMVSQGLNPDDAKDRKAAGARLGKSGTFINWRLDSLKLRPDIQKLADNGTLNANQVCHLAWCDNSEQQWKLFQLIARGQCKTHTQLEAALKALKEGADVADKKPNNGANGQQDLGLVVEDKSKAIAVIKKIEGVAADFVKMNSADKSNDFDLGLEQMSVGELQHLAQVLGGLEKMIRSIHKNKIVYREQAILASQLSAQDPDEAIAGF